MNSYRSIHLHGRTRWWGVLAVLIMGAGQVYAQPSEKVCRSEYRIDPRNENKLFVTVDNLNFFRNNEWVSSIVPGYTLPGFWLQPKAVYYPLKNIKIEGGFHSLWFWGTNQYPSYAYRDLPALKGNELKKAHLLPYFRVQAALSDQVNIILGDIYGGANHRLAEPLYNPELNLTADPEAGLQLLWHTHWMDFDTWVNWESFIYKMEAHQEGFSFGLSTRFMCNRPDTRFHVYFPLQVLAQHRGGQIDTTDLPVHTAFNGATGVGLDWNLRWGLLRKINLEWNLTGYYQHAGNLWPLKRGYGNYAALSFEIDDFSVKSAYWKCDRFISMFGNPLYGAPSLAAQDAYFEHPEMVTLSVAYTRSFASGLAMGIDFDLFQRFAGNLNDPASGISPATAHTNYSFGIYFRINPSFLIKAF
ncbi:MAG: hypothetical protein LBT78_08275 [Tannerella sp.]|jgi:hypothetical protein|nr:hypothetical protein [Tannerella sp.]